MPAQRRLKWLAGYARSAHTSHRSPSAIGAERGGGGRRASRTKRHCHHAYLPGVVKTMQRPMVHRLPTGYCPMWTAEIRVTASPPAAPPHSVNRRQYIQQIGSPAGWTDVRALCWQSSVNHVERRCNRFY
uniref:Uncharacterized protein n=1 Tax=Plectus sambesii TaxID=2011161 RepID=A0A914V0X4_9BILA